MTHRTNIPIDSLQAIVRRIRGRVVKMSHDARASHLGSSLSCIDILAALYWETAKVDPSNVDDPARDRVILSKGHASAALYATLAERGFFSPELLDTYGQEGGCLAEQMGPGCASGIEAATGSLGHGLSLGLGMALASRIAKLPCRVWVVLSDGECNEGSVWEAAMLATAQHVSNLTAIVDYNGWQATGRSDEIMALPSLKEKWQAFGFASCEVDGHNIEQLHAVLQRSTQEKKRPTAIIARTVKGKGVSFMEDDNNWHYRIPDDVELKAALEELGQA